MDCAQALAVAAAALVLAGEPVVEPMARAQEALLIASLEAEAALQETTCAASALWSRAHDHGRSVHLAFRFEPAPRVPDARIHTALRHPI